MALRKDWIAAVADSWSQYTTTEQLVELRSRKKRVVFNSASEHVRTSCFHYREHLMEGSGGEQIQMDACLSFIYSPPIRWFRPYIPLLSTPLLCIQALLLPPTPLQIQWSMRGGGQN